MNNRTHGYDGPIAISNGGQVTQLAQDFLRAAHAIGIPFSGTYSPINQLYLLSHHLLADDLQGDT